jgi:hypothetical protein
MADGREIESEGQRWRQIFEAERARAERCIELDRKRPRRHTAKSEAARAWWASVSELLVAYARLRTHAKLWPDPEPLEALLALAHLADDLAAGTLPEMIRDVAEAFSGRPMGRAERHALAYAVLYIEAALRGEIEDRFPKKTVSEIYGVSAQTVRNWLGRRDELLVRFPSANMDATVLASRMRHAGHRYSKVGRGSTAT